jgi:hypothetical protein
LRVESHPWKEIEKLLAETLIEPYREYYLMKRDLAQIVIGHPFEGR